MKPKHIIALIIFGLLLTGTVVASDYDTNNSEYAIAFGAIAVLVSIIVLGMYAIIQYEKPLYYRGNSYTRLDIVLSDSGLTFDEIVMAIDKSEIDMQLSRKGKAYLCDDDVELLKRKKAME